MTRTKLNVCVISNLQNPSLPFSFSSFPPNLFFLKPTDLGFHKRCKTFAEIREANDARTSVGLLSPNMETGSQFFRASPLFIHAATERTNVYISHFPLSSLFLRGLEPLSFPHIFRILNFNLFIESFIFDFRPHNGFQFQYTGFIQIQINS